MIFYVSDCLFSICSVWLFVTFCEGTFNFKNLKSEGSLAEGSVEAQQLKTGCAFLHDMHVSVILTDSLTRSSPPMNAPWFSWFSSDKSRLLLILAILRAVKRNLPLLCPAGRERGFHWKSLKVFSSSCRPLNSVTILMRLGHKMPHRQTWLSSSWNLLLAETLQVCLMTLESQHLFAYCDLCNGDKRSVLDTGM
jgi:hypothetical protein